MKKMTMGSGEGTKSLYEAPVTYPRTVEKDGYFCISADVDPFPNWPLEMIYVGVAEVCKEMRKEYPSLLWEDFGGKPKWAN